MVQTVMVNLIDSISVGCSMGVCMTGGKWAQDNGVYSKSGPAKNKNCKPCTLHGPVVQVNCTPAYVM